MEYDADRLKNFWDSIPREKIEEVNQRSRDEHQRQVKAFRDGYANDTCYLCGKNFSTLSKSNPCLHWLLRRCKFKKKNFSKVYNKYGYVNIAAYLRWCANEERPLANINDLQSEQKEGKIISYTIKWKNIEWTFDCSRNDFSGHKGLAIYYPHYHFQMRIDGRQFINFNDFHLPFDDHDLFVLNSSIEHGDIFGHDFGSAGAGMEDAMNFPVDDILEFSGSSSQEDESLYHLSTMIEASDEPISGDEIEDIRAEAARAGKTFTYIAKQRLGGRASVRTVITPSDSITDIASRTEHKRR